MERAHLVASGRDNGWPAAEANHSATATAREAPPPTQAAAASSVVDPELRRGCLAALQLKTELEDPDITEMRQRVQQLQERAEAAQESCLNAGLAGPPPETIPTLFELMKEKDKMEEM